MRPRKGGVAWAQPTFWAEPPERSDPGGPKPPENALSVTACPALRAQRCVCKKCHTGYVPVETDPGYVLAAFQVGLLGFALSQRIAALAW